MPTSVYVDSPACGLGVEAHGRPARVAEPEALRMPGDLAEALLQLAQVARERGLVLVEQPAARREPAVLLRVLLLPGDVGREEVRVRRDVREHRVERDERRRTVASAGISGHQRRSATASTTNAPASAAIVERDSVSSSAADHSAASPATSHGRRRDQPAAATSSAIASTYARAQRAQEQRRQPPEHARARVEDEVLRQPARPVVVVALVAVEAGRARVAPPLDRHRVEVDQPERGDGRRGARERPAERPELRGGSAAASARRGTRAPA